MPETNYYWQGGRRIAVRKDPAAITIHATDSADAEAAAADAGVELREIERATPELMRAEVVGDRDESVDRLRASDRIVHHVYRDAHDGEHLITESFFIKFKPETTDQQILDYMNAESLVVERALPDKTYLVRVTTATGRNPIRAANDAAERAEVEYAEPNLVRPLERFSFIPTDELFAQQWHLHAPSAGTDLLAGAGIFAPEAWDITRGSRDVVVAVADDGFDLTHADFQGPGKVAGRLNATLRGNGSNAAIDWDDDPKPRPGDYHGTPCLGVAVAEGNGTGVVGVAPGCSLLAVRFPLTAMTDAHFIVMFEKISTLADVVSCSWGVGPANAPMSTALRDAMTRLAATGGRRGKGLVFCIAAGNNNCPVQDLENTKTYKYRSKLGMRTYDGPIDRWVAAHPDALTVSASTSRKTRAAYSSWGKQIAVCAPSDNWDDLGQLAVRGRGIVTTDNEGVGPHSDFTEGSRFTDQFGGTSSATPTVAGACGLVISANPALAADKVRQIIRDTADKDLSFETDTPVNGAGAFDANGFSLWFGNGKLNAFQAVTAARGLSPQEETVDVRQDAELTIPDEGAPVFGRIDIAHDGRIAEFRVQVKIAHSYIGDLRMDLVAPDGTRVVLHDHAGGSSDNIQRTYTAQNTPALGALASRPIRGTWKLRVADTFRFDEGRLKSWRIAARVTLA